jgi:hypothetical protein
MQLGAEAEWAGMKDIVLGQKRYPISRLASSGEIFVIHVSQMKMP